MSDKCPLSCRVYSRPIRFSRDVAGLKGLLIFLVHSSCRLKRDRLPLSIQGGVISGISTGTEQVPDVNSYPEMMQYQPVGISGYLFV